MADSSEAPFDVIHTEHLWIEMADGIRLAARLWRPQSKEPVPAILEYIPYRKADMVRARDERNHPFFAVHGYACIRVDMRGSGDSEGHMPDMYAPAELSDAREVIEWLARQPWCNGRVGMFGTSWGGTASLQASVDAPEPLKAVIAVCATHDRFEDDIHYMGGCVLTDTFEWGATLPAILASPPTASSGPDWMARWRARIQALEFPLDNWLHQKGRGAYWRNGSVIHQADRISVPILSVGGWSDRYSNSVMALLEACPDLVWGVIGPWGHHYPDHGVPGPAIGFQRLALDWWDRWLRPEPAPPTDWPRLQVWLRTFDKPGDTLPMRHGHWMKSGGPPSKEIASETISLDNLARCPAKSWFVSDDPFIGMASGDTGYFGRPGGLPLEQTEDDRQSLVFETDPLDQDMVLFGAVVIQLNGRNPDKCGQLAVRLVDVAPDGQAGRIAYGLRNLGLNAQLDSPNTPAQGDEFDVLVMLHTTAYRVKKGHRLRIAISQALWPLIWTGSPSGPVEILAGSIRFPVMQKPISALAVALPPAEDLPLHKSHEVRAAPALKRWRKRSGRGAEVGWHQPLTTVAYADVQTVFGYETKMTYRLSAAMGLSEEVEFSHEMRFQRSDGEAVVKAELFAASEGRSPRVRSTLTVYWNDEMVGQRQWTI